MDMPQIHASTARTRLMTSLVLAIEEARMVKDLLSRKDSRERRLEDCKKLINLEREIDYLETTLIEIRSQADNESSQ